MREYITLHLKIAGTLILIIVAVVLGIMVSHARQEKVTESIVSLLRTQEDRMGQIAEITDRNGADDSLKEILKECSSRGEFESFLGRLGTLTRKELLMTQSLFEGCGSFEREQKAIMVEKLEREFRMYQELEDLLSTLVTDESVAERSGLWKEVVDHEVLRSALLNDLTKIQEEIIVELVQGASIQGVRVRELVAEAQNIQQLISVYDQKIDTARNTLLSK